MFSLFITSSHISRCRRDKNLLFCRRRPLRQSDNARRCPPTWMPRRLPLIWRN